MGQHHYRGIPITPTADGRWQATATVGRRPNGRRDRRHREGRTVAEVREKLRKLLREVDTGRAPRIGRVPTVEQWLETWLTDIAPHGRRALARGTIRSYRAVIRHWIVPELGGLPLDHLEPEDLDRLYATMRRAGKAESYLLKAHYILSRALGVAMRRRYITHNVTEMVDPPESSEGNRTPLPRDVVRRALEIAAQRRNAARWYVGLAAGPRQGETLGLPWDCVDLDACTYRKEWQLQRFTWAHGCDDPVECAQPRCRAEPCRPRWEHGCGDPAGCRIQAWRCPARRPGRCGRHPRDCPAPCESGCTGHARHCPDRRGGGLVLTRPKTWRPNQPVAEVALPAGVVRLLREHRARQDAERLRAGTAWRRIRYPDGTACQLVFTTEDGSPIDPRRDWEEWQEILIEAGAPRARVHAMRHTTATTLLELGEDIAVVQEILGHTDIRTTRMYTTVTAKVTKKAAKRMDKELFGKPARAAGEVADLAAERSRRRRSQ